MKMREVSWQVRWERVGVGMMVGLDEVNFR